MQEIILRQRSAPRALTGRSFLLSVAGILLRLAVAQILVNLLIGLTGIGLLNVVFYLYAVWLLVGFMRRTVASYVYTLREGVLFLERKLGDSTITVVEISLDSVVSLREVHMAENLRTTYRQVTAIDPQSRPSARTRAAFAASVVSASLARRIAGRRAQDVIGHVLVYDEGGARRACTFCPDEAMQKALAGMLCERFGFDERMTHARVTTLYARALERAFPALYPFVDPLIDREEVDQARAELARRKAERAQRKAAKKTVKKPEERRTKSAAHRGKQE